jgi:hypothetical protein
MFSCFAREGCVNHALVGPGGRAVEGKAKFVFPILATAVVVFAASAVVTYSNIGFRGDFVRRWLFAFIVGWPVAAATAYMAFPFVRSTTTRIVALIERK